MGKKVRLLDGEWPIHACNSFFWAVPSSVPTSEALFPCRPSQHPYLWPHPGFIPHRGPAPRGPQEKSDYWWAAYPKETLHRCWVTLVVFRSACSDWTYAGHCLLCPLLMTMLTKMQSQIEWVSPQSRPPLHPSTNPPVWLSEVDGFDQNCLRPGRRNTETEATMTAWHEGLQKPRRFFSFSLFNLYSDWRGRGWKLMMLWRSISVWDHLTGLQTTKLTVIIILALTWPGNCGTCSVGQVIN